MTTIINSWDEFEALPYEVQLALQKMTVVAIVAGGITAEITPLSAPDLAFGAAAQDFMTSYQNSAASAYKIGVGLYEQFFAHCAIQILKQYRI